jgi:lipooligosaccharide transport system ATP-binding protein
VSVLTLSNVRKSFGEREVVRGVSFSIAKGVCFGLLGPNGAGKTTTLRMCLGLSHATSGDISLFGHTLPDMAVEARKRVGVVPQFDNLDPDFTCAENLMVWGRYFGISDEHAASKTPELMEFAGLTGRENANIKDLSGGMKRRLTLARALINNPDLLVLDEPTTGLDPQARHLIWDRLKELTRRGVTILITTHFMDEAERLCDQIAVMDQGALIASGSPRTLIDSTIEPDVIEVFSDADAAILPIAQAAATPHCARVEQSGETLFCYTRGPRAALDALTAIRGARVLHRPANLEDVFIKLTGRELRD